ncbi:cheW-like domain protein [Collimonas arenae]|uniref:Chemotaxis protein CheW n=1 Tax=Collimonas arenae TaxID=279058 RepID=A0A127QIG1_9BURK|nr:chemotaxis protein CheW [Collimonas arenae]AMP09786.1 cheW-like domain protein [Collimonas arenae]
MTPSSHQQAASKSVQIDDCWNRIGVRGDGSCTQLALHIDCRNCPVHARAAAELLDRLQTDDLSYNGEQQAEDEQQDGASLKSLLLFRIGEEWLALPTVLFEEVTELRPVHGLPHQKNATVLGIANIRGELVTCVSLAAMLGVDNKRTQTTETTTRLLVVQRHGHATAFSADEVYGTLRVATAAHQSVPTTLPRGAGHFTRAVIQWNDHSVGLLDEELLFHTLDRSLHD